MKSLVIFAVAVLLLSFVVMAEPENTIEEIVEFVEKKGIDVSEENITEVDFEDLPGEVDIEKVDNTSVSIFRVDFSDKPFFVVTAASMKEGVRDPVCMSRPLFYFGSDGEVSQSGFLKMSGGAESSAENGYVMIRSGSITGLSSSLKVLDFVEGAEVELIIYKNGREVGFRNSLDAGGIGVKIDYDVMSEDIVRVKPGDVVSASVKFDEGVLIEDVSFFVEVSG